MAGILFKSDNRLMSLKTKPEDEISSGPYQPTLLTLGVHETATMYHNNTES